VQRLRAALTGGPQFPTPATTGCRAPSASLYEVSTGSTAAEANSWLGVSTNSGWTCTSLADGTWDVSPDAVFWGLNIAGTLAVLGTSGDFLAGVTVSECAVASNGPYGIATDYTTGCTISNCTVSGLDAAANRVTYAIADKNGASAGWSVLGCNIYWWRIGVLPGASALVQGCCIHDAGFQGGDHTECLSFGAGNAITVTGCTLLNPLPQTAAIAAYQPGMSDVTVTQNLMAGGSYTLYLGESDATSIVVTGNCFSAMYYAAGGSAGAAYPGNVNGVPAYGSDGNVWAGNTWYDGPSAGTAISAP
jgi:Right handed beta helix region